MSDTVGVRGAVAIILSSYRAIAVDAVPDDPQLLGVAEVDPAPAGEDVEGEVSRFVDAAVLSLEGHRPREVYLGLPGSWMSHMVVSTPPLRKLDRIAMFVREASKATHAPLTDLLLADYLAKAEGRGSQAHLVIASRQSMVVGIASGLRSKGFRVRAAASSPAAAVLDDILKVTSDGRGDSAGAVVLLRHDGFAIAIHQGLRLHQFRLVGVAIQDDDDAIAQVLIEELRRASMSFREKTRGKTLTQAIVLGHVAGDSERIAEVVSNHTGIPTLIRESARAGGDALIEAVTLTQIHRKSEARSLDMLPAESKGRSKSLIYGALTGAAVSAAIALACWGAGRLDDEVAHRQISLQEAELLRGSLGETVARYGELLQRTQSLAAMKSELERIGNSRVDAVDMLHKITQSLPESIRLDRVAIQNPTWGVTTVEIDGFVHTGEWEFDFHLSQFVERVKDATGIAPSIDHSASDGSVTSQVHPFKIRMTWNTEADESDTKNDPAESA